MPERVLIAPSILAADFARLGEQVREAEAAGADMIHVDVMDGRFVPNISVGPPVVAALRRVTSLPLDVHLMIVEPERYVEAFAAAGASYITVHVEACRHLDRVLTMIREAGAHPGVTLNPGTPVSLLEHALPLVDLVLVMTVNPGFGGQELLAYALGKVGAIRKGLAQCGNDGCLIEVDGGISPATLGQAVRAGADVLVMGSAIFGHPSGVAQAMAETRRAIEEASH
jgi:ribulose-phosphate 3-epimerase